MSELVIHATRFIASENGKLNAALDLRTVGRTPSHLIVQHYTWLWVGNSLILGVAMGGAVVKCHHHSERTARALGL
jgi:hypothetical protein